MDDSGLLTPVSAPRCVTRRLLEQQASAAPQRLFARFEDGVEWNYGQLLHEVQHTARQLESLGVQASERVLLCFGNGSVAVRLFLALQYLGAVPVPINTGYRGALLAHVLANTGARLMLADERLVERLEDIELAELQTLVVDRATAFARAGLSVIALEAVGRADRFTQGAALAPWDEAVVIYTSGTTGPSKGVLCSYAHLHATATAFRHLGPDDRSLVALPLFHIGGVLGIYCALLHGGSLYMVEAFSVSGFWPTVRRHGITSTGLLGVMLPFLLKQPAAAHDRDHGLKTVLVAPLDDAAPLFAERFGVQIYTEYNMTELCMPLFCGPQLQVRGTCGQVRPGVELRLVDEHDIEVPTGEVGELVVRTAQPWQLSHGYLNNPQATAEAWRNGWFHTGDALRRDEAGYFFFVDRKKDAMRRRGENISSFEVESELTAHPRVREAVVVGVPSEVSEDEVLAVIALVPGEHLDPLELLEFLKPRMAAFMLPRYVRFLDELPKTPTHKVLKHQLRDEGVTADTWDREQHDVPIRRERLAPRSES